MVVAWAKVSWHVGQVVVGTRGNRVGRRWCRSCNKSVGVGKAGREGQVG